MKVFTMRSCLPRVTMPAVASRGIAASTMFSRTDRSGMMPSALRSSGSSAIPSRSDAAGDRRFSFRPPTVTDAVVERQRADDRLRGLRPARAEQPAQPGDLAGAHVEGDTVEHVALAQTVHLQQWLDGACAAVVAEPGHPFAFHLDQIAAQHVRDQREPVEPFHRTRCARRGRRAAR